MAKDLMSLFDDLDRHEYKAPHSRDEDVVKAPFGYPGGKSKSAANILKYLPYNKRYIEPFGGSGAVLLARKSSPLEVFNDRYAGVVAFYRCLRNPEKYTQLVDWLDLTIHSREDFVDAKNTWCDEADDVVRAGKWYYMVNYSFGSLGRNFGRATSPRGLIAGKITNKLKMFPFIHERLRKVQVENQDWEECIRDYDAKDAIFYLDPPYVDAYPGLYKDRPFKHDDHYKLIDRIFHTKGFCAISGYSNPLYENQKWDSRHEWEVFSSADSCAFTENNNKKNLEGKTSRCNITEVLWIKEAR